MPGRNLGGGNGGGASSSAIRRLLGMDIGMDEGEKAEACGRPKRPDLSSRLGSSIYIAGGGPPGSLGEYREGMSIMCQLGGGKQRGPECSCSTINKCEKKTLVAGRQRRGKHNKRGDCIIARYKRSSSRK